MSTYNTNNNNTNEATKNPYGHLLDKYLDSNHVDWQTKQQREEEAKNRYGHLLDYAKPDNSTLELIARMEDGRIERKKQLEEDKKMAALKNQERIDAVRRKEDAHNARVRGYAESIMANRETKRKEAEKAEQEKREAEERQQRMYDNISGLIRINPKLAEGYLQTLKENGII